MTCMKHWFLDSVLQAVDDAAKASVLPQPSLRHEGDLKGLQRAAVFS